MARRWTGLLVFLTMLCAAEPGLPQFLPLDFQAAAEEAAKLAGPWTTVAGIHAGKDLTREQLAQIKFTAGNAYGLELAPLIPRGPWPTGYLCNVSPAAKRIQFSRNIGLKGISYHGFYEVKDDTLRISLQLLPWERSSADPSFHNWATFQPDTVLTFKKAPR